MVIQVLQDPQAVLALLVLQVHKVQLGRQVLQHQQVLLDLLVRQALLETKDQLGTAGTPGATGAQGPTGSAGTAGVTGAQGPTGATGTNVLQSFTPVNAVDAKGVLVGATVPVGFAANSIILQYCTPSISAPGIVSPTLSQDLGAALKHIGSIETASIDNDVNYPDSALTIGANTPNNISIGNAAVRTSMYGPMTLTANAGAGGFSTFYNYGSQFSTTGAFVGTNLVDMYIYRMDNLVYGVISWVNSSSFLTTSANTISTTVGFSSNFRPSVQKEFSIIINVAGVDYPAQLVISTAGIITYRFFNLTNIQPVASSQNFPECSHLYCVPLLFIISNRLINII